MVKTHRLRKTETGMSVQEFHDYWRTKHGPLVKSVPGCRKYIRKYLQCHTIRRPTNATPRRLMG